MIFFENVKPDDKPWNKKSLPETMRRKILNDLAVQAIKARIAELEKTTNAFFATTDQKSLKQEKIDVLRAIVQEMENCTVSEDGSRFCDRYPSYNNLPNKLHCTIKRARESSKQVDEGKLSHKTKDLLDQIIVECETFEKKIKFDNQMQVSSQPVINLSNEEVDQPSDFNEWSKNLFGESPSRTSGYFFTASFFRKDERSEILLYWLAKNNSQAIRSLLQRKRFSVLQLSSALFEAALQENLAEVNLLLHEGARADQCFHNNPMQYFIPKLIFEILLKAERGHLEIDSIKRYVACLELLLNHLSLHNPENLAFQLRIPVEDKRNIFDSLTIRLKYPNEKNEGSCQAITTMHSLLSKFKATNGDLASKDELIKDGDIDTGFTIGEIARMK